MTERDSAIGSKYFAHPRVDGLSDREYTLCRPQGTETSFHHMKYILYLSSALGLTHSGWAFIDPRNLGCSAHTLANHSYIHAICDIHHGYVSSVSNSSSFGPGGYYRSAWQRPYPNKNRRFFKRTITLRPQILIREYSVWYVKYATLHGASFGRLRFSISLNLSKRQPKILVFTPKMIIFSKQLAEFQRYQKSETTRRCAACSCIFHVPNTKLSDEYSWT